jgi:hypothetical protein
MADFATHQSASLHGRIFTSFLPGSRREAWWEQAENGMNHHGKIGSLSLSILVVDFGSGRFYSSCSASREKMSRLVASGTPELVGARLPDSRGHAIGTQLLNHLLEAGRGVSPAVMLSVRRRVMEPDTHHPTQSPLWVMCQDESLCSPLRERMCDAISTVTHDALTR